MDLFLIRHKKSRLFMPLMKRGRGYTHWNPNTEEGQKVFAETKLPRFFISYDSARRTIDQWKIGILKRTFSHGGYFDEDTSEYLDLKEDGRSKDDLEIVKVRFLEIKQCQISK